jgi:hypothetical protein
MAAVNDAKIIISADADGVVTASSKANSALGTIKTAAMELYAKVMLVKKAFDWSKELTQLAGHAQAAEYAFAAMAESQGVNGAQLLADLKTQTQGTIDQSGLAQEALKALAADIPAELITGLGGASEVASRLMGTTVEEAFNSIIDSVATGMPKALKKTMLITKDELAALQAAAPSMEVGDFQKEMAHIAVIEGIIKGYKMQQEAIELLTTQQQRYNAAWKEFKETVGDIIAAVFPPILGFFQLVWSGLLRVSQGIYYMIAGIGKLISLIPFLGSVGEKIKNFGLINAQSTGKLSWNSANKGLINMGIIDGAPIKQKYTRDQYDQALSDQKKWLADMKLQASKAGIYKAQAEELKAQMELERQHYEQSKLYIDMETSNVERLYKNRTSLLQQEDEATKMHTEMEKAYYEILYKGAVISENEYSRYKDMMMQRDLDNRADFINRSVELDRQYYAQKAETLIKSYIGESDMIQKELELTKQYYEALRNEASTKKNSLGKEGYTAELKKITEQETAAMEKLRTQAEKADIEYYKNRTDLAEQSIQKEIAAMNTWRNALVSAYKDALTAARQYDDKARAIGDMIAANNRQYQQIFFPAKTAKEQYEADWKNMQELLRLENFNMFDEKATNSTIQEILGFMSKYKDFKNNQNGLFPDGEDSSIRIRELKESFSELQNKLSGMKADNEALRNSMLMWSDDLAVKMAAADQSVAALNAEMVTLNNQILNIAPLKLDTSGFEASIRAAINQVSQLNSMLNGQTFLDTNPYVPPGYDPGTGDYIGDGTKDEASPIVPTYIGVSSAVHAHARTQDNIATHAGAMSRAGVINITLPKIEVQGVNDPGELARRLVQPLRRELKRLDHINGKKYGT